MTLTTTPVIMPDTFPFAECFGAGCKGQLLDFGNARNLIAPED